MYKMKIKEIKTKKAKLAKQNINSLNNFYFNFNIRNQKEIIILIIISLHLFLPILNKKITNLRQLNLQWEINLTIKGTGEQYILNENNYERRKFSSIPSEILVNGVSQTYIGYKVYNLTEEINNITLKWNYAFSNLDIMFYSMSNIINIDFSKFDSSHVTCMYKMFQDCKSLVSINFNNFNTTSVIDMRDVFLECTSLESLDLSGFDTSSTTKMSKLFCRCSSLKALNLSNFDTSKVTDMSKMFYECNSLISLNLNNFNTSSVINMESMFKDCKALKFLEISSFDTSSVTNMNRMFASCRELTSLNISNFNTSLVTDMECMFYNCKLITSLDLNKFDTSKVKTMSKMFENCNSLKTLDLNNFITTSVENMNEMFKNCKDLISLNIESFDTSKVVNMFNMFGYCSSLISLNLTNFNTTNVINLTYFIANCNKDLIFCLNETQLPKIASEINLTNPNYINECSNEVFNTIIEESDTSKEEDINTNIIKESDTSIEDYISTNIKKESDTSSEEDFDTNIIKESDTSCEENINYINCTLLDFFNNKCLISNDPKYEEQMINFIRSEILKDPYNSFINTIFNEKKDYIVEDKNIIYQLTSSYNQNNKDYINISIINLGDCEKKLNEYYGINNDNNNSLLIFKVDFYDEAHSTPKVEYEIYDYNKKQRLNLSICHDIPIEIEVPASINENELFKYNISSDYYNDKCFPYTTEDKTDIILNDRKKEYYQNNMSLCEKDCKYNGYKNKSKRAKCECKVKEEFRVNFEFEFDKDKLYELLDFKNSINIYVIKCYELFFSKDGLIKNIGSYFILLIILLDIILLMIFLKKDFNLLNNKIFEMIKIKCQNKEGKIIKKNNNEINNKILKKKKEKNKRTVLINRKLKEIMESKNNPPKNKKKKTIKIHNYKTVGLTSGKPNKSLKIKIKGNIINNNNNKYNKYNKNKIYKLEYNDYEINTLRYKEALLLDKRKYFEYYLSQLKRKQLLIFTFYTKDDYNSFIIKLSLFLYKISTFFAVNALCFLDSTMHGIYVKKGSFDFIYQLPNIIISTIISSINNAIITYLSLSEKNILKIKKRKEKSYDKLKIVSYEIIKCLIIKFIFFFLLNFIYLILYWYYLGCFCAVFKNTQSHLIKDISISFLLSLIYPFGLSLLPGVLRIPALNSSKRDKECIYKISQIIQII